MFCVRQPSLGRTVTIPGASPPRMNKQGLNMPTVANPFGSESQLTASAGTFRYYRLQALAEQGIGHIDKLPYSIKVLLESCLRNVDNFEVHEKDVTRLAGWNAAN